MASQMAADVQKRIRALPGNTVCVDCDNINPQWASTSYGSLMCLECSGHHRSLGVHLSFVRSIAMDSWKEREIQAMEKSGGNAKSVEYFESRGIKKNMNIATKYNTKQAEYLRNRLTRWLDGKTEPPPDPGRYDPVTGVSEAQGAEPMPGETTEQYNERQAKLRDAARERMRAKFGNGGMSGMGAGGSVGYDGSGGGGGGGDGDGLTDKLGGALSGLGSFFKEKVIDNEKVRGAVGGVGQVAGGAFNKLRESERFGGAADKVGGLVGGIAGKLTGGGGDNNFNNIEANRANIREQEKAFWDRMYEKPAASPAPAPPAKNTSFDFDDSSPSRGFGGNISKAVSAPVVTRTMSNNGRAKAVVDDDWGDWGDDFANPSPPDQTERQRAKTLDEPKSTGLGDSSPETQRPKSMTMSDTKPATNGTSGYQAAPAPTPTPAPAPAPVKKPAMMETSPAPAAKKAPAKLVSADDFFADFGM